MEQLTGILEEATAAVAEPYFLLPAEGGHTRYRERVYCYELYHQMRRRWPPDTDYFLNGELDKFQHPYFGERDRTAPKPDFLIHVPGERRNYAAIEVKASSGLGGYIKDIRTLATLIGRCHYVRAIYLIYGPTPRDAALRRIKARAVALGLEQLEIWLHPIVGRSCTLSDL